MDEQPNNDGKTDTTATAEALTQDVSRLKEGVVQIAADAKAHGLAHVEKAKQKVTEAQKRMNDAVANAQAQLSARPLTVLGIGVVLGFLFGRRGRRKRHRAE